jgi:hypothetical protein
LYCLQYFVTLRIQYPLVISFAMRQYRSETPFRALFWNCQFMAPKARTIRPAQCGACMHAERARLEALRVGGVPLRVLAKQFSLSKDVIHRHFKSHVSPQRKAELMAGPAKVEQLANAAAGEGRALLDYLGITRTVLFNRFLACAEAGDNSGVSNIAGRLLESLRELGRVTGELREVSGVSITHNTLNVVGSPEFAALSKGLVAIARAHPAARADIVALLRGLDAPLAPASKPDGGHPPMIEAEAVHAA